METGVYILDYKGHFAIGIFYIHAFKKRYSKPFKTVTSRYAAAAVAVFLGEGLKEKGLA